MLLIDEKILIIHMKKCAGKSVCKGIIKTLPDERLRYLGYTDESEAESTLARRNGKPWKHSTAAEAIEWAGKPKSALEAHSCFCPSLARPFGLLLLLCKAQKPNVSR